MDIQAYIDSGVIESYVLGMAEAQEAAQLEQLSHQYPEIRKAIDAFETALEKTALANAMPPPENAKRKLLALLENEFVKEAAIVVPIKKNFSFMKYVAAASVILLLGSATLNVYFYTQFKSTSTAYQALFVEKNGLLAEKSEHTD